jgi:hypothetical protein
VQYLSWLEVEGGAVGLGEGGAVGLEHLRCLLGEGGREVGRRLEVHSAAGRPHAAHKPLPAQSLLFTRLLLKGQSNYILEFMLVSIK